MGTTTTKEQQDQSVDIIHLLPQNKRVEDLVYGYIRCRTITDDLNKIFPNEIKYLCKMYLDIHIQSNTEIELQQMTPLRRRIMVLGARAVGKTTITYRYVTDDWYFDDFGDDIIEDSYQRQSIIDGRKVILDILDICGDQIHQRDYFQCDYMIKEREAFLLVYSITSRQSFMDLKDIYYKIIDRYHEEDITKIPIVLIGNKCDLSNRYRDYRQVSIDEGKQLADLWNVTFYETSAKIKINISESFEMLIREIRKKSIIDNQGSNSTKASCCNIM